MLKLSINNFINKTNFLFFSIYIFLFLTTSSFSATDPYIGYWIMPDKKVVIEIQKMDSKYIGYVRWLKDPTYPKGDPMEGIEQTDRNNSDLLLSKRKVLGLQVVGDLKLDLNTNKLTDGWIYDSWNGRMYYGSAEPIDENSLKLRGSFDKWGILGYSMIVKRVKLTSK